MANGYIGKILNVNLNDRNIVAESLNEDLCRDYIGGYGIGARLLYERIPADYSVSQVRRNTMGLPALRVAETGSRFSYV